MKRVFIRQFSKKYLPDETPRSINFSAEHPAFPSFKRQKRTRWIAFIGAIGVTAYTFYEAWSMLHAEANPEDPEKLKQQLKRAQLKPGVHVFGDNRYHLVDPSSDSPKIEYKMLLEEKLRDLKFAEMHAAAIDRNGDLIQWGDLFSADAKAPKATIKGMNLVQIALTKTRIYGLTARGYVYEFPVEEKNQPKNLSFFGSMPGYIHSKEKIKQISAENDSIKAISVNQNPYKLNGQQLIRIESTVKFEQIECGSDHCLFKAIDGRVFGLGQNKYGQLAAGETGEQQSQGLVEIQTIWNRFKKSAKPENVQCLKAAAGGNTSLFLVGNPTEYTLVSSGFGQFGQLGGSFKQAQLHPQPVKNVPLVEFNEQISKTVAIPVKQLLVSSSHCALVLETAKKSFFKTEFGNDVLVWGSNSHGQLRRLDGKNGNSCVPVWMRGFQDGIRLQLSNDQRLVLGEGITAIFSTSL